MGAIISGGKLAAAGAVAGGLAVGGALIALSAAIDITPKPIEAEAPTTPDDPGSDSRTLLLASLRDLIEHSHAVLGIASGQAPIGSAAGGFGGETASIVLWTRDDLNPGVVNLGELLIVSHRPVLGAITATTFEFDSADGGVGPAAPAHALASPDPVEALRGSAPPVTRVIATDVRAVSIEQAPAHGSAAQLILTLTWDGPSADVPKTSVVAADAPRRRTP